METLYDTLIAIRSKLNAGISLLPAEQTLWDEWLHQRGIKDDSLPDREKIDVFLSLEEQKEPWELFKETAQLTFDTAAEEYVAEEAIPVTRWYKSRVLGVAATVLLILLTIFFVQRSSKKQEPDVIANSTLHPSGTGKVTLYLANQTPVALENIAESFTEQQGDLVLSVSNTGGLQYRQHSTSPVTSGSFNRVETTTGKSYPITLSDGTVVVLNANSSITIPLSFSDINRVVEISGEAYFEVAQRRVPSGQKAPFRVLLTEGTEVEVLGTHFNISAYHNDPAVTTTLLEGSVKVRVAQQEKIMTPGQQVIATDTSMEIRNDVDPADAVSWTSNQFSFNNMKLTAIMRTLERWYGIKVTYKGAIDDMSFNIGNIDRTDPVTKILHIMQATGGITYEKKDNEVFISK